MMAANLRYQLLFPQSFSRIYNKTSDSLINRCGGITPLSSRRLSDHASLAQGRRERRNQSSHINYASLERGVTKYYCNRNPRSLELLGMADKPLGFGTKNQRMDYYHRLMLDMSLRHVTAYVNHNSGSKVVQASTKEFCISRHLHKTSDTAAAFNIGRVIALRCKETGLDRVMWEHKWDRKHKKVVAFMRGVRLGGLILNEPKPRKTLPKSGTLPHY